MVAALAGIAVQLIPLPSFLVALLSPHRLAFIRASALGGAQPSFVPLTLEASATLHGLLATLCVCLTFWTARTLFAKAGLRAAMTGLAWVSIAFVLVAFAQSAGATNHVYGFWQPTDAGARPFGPFINRNHGGTWSLLALFLCFGCLQWRRAVDPPGRARNWRARVAQALDGRSLILGLAVLLLTVSVAAGASRSAMLGLGGASLFVAIAAPREAGRGRQILWTTAIAVAAFFAVIAFADLDRLVARLDETRSLGLAQRVAIWRDTLGIVRDFPLAGVGAGNFANAMRLYQSSDRTYYWNEAHNEYLQIAAEGGLLLAIPVTVGLVALYRAGRSAYAHSEPLRWMRLGAAAALVAVAVQAIWETGLTLPANGMLAAVAAAILVHTSRHGANAAPRP
jgi:O-antigen ligase